MTVNVSDWSETPDANSTVNGINIAEHCSPDNVNGGMRAIMAGVKTLSLTIPATASFMPKAGGTFSGPITLSGAGAFRYNVDSTLTSGRTYFLINGSSRPSSPQEGDLVWYYT